MDGQSEEAPSDAQTHEALDAQRSTFSVVCDHCGSTVPLKFSFCPRCGQKIALKTIPALRRHVVETPKPKCMLTIIPDTNPSPLNVQPSTTYEGESIMLTRSNTDPMNPTITSKNQAQLTCEDGKWFIENHSELKSTLLECNRKMEIMNGDVIILGDRKFKFNSEPLQD